ncbi:MAG TPA: hypothetical protein VJ810_00405 [Blastocatellia bacterium]|nr:hypothetical protein [Blastocatellia bacterium]
MIRRALKLIGLSLACAMALATGVLAQGAAAVEGAYNVTATSAEIGSVNFVMTIKRAGGKWTAEIKDSPTPLTVTSITVDETNKITIVADSGGTAVTINGKFDKDAIAGDWSAGDIKGTWKGLKKDDVAAAKPADKPSAAPAAAGSEANIEGTYDAKVIADGQGELTFTLVIKRNGDKLVTEVTNGGDLNIVGVDVKEGDAVTLSATFQGNPFQLPGKRTGSEMSGKWEAGGFSGSWSAKKK